MISVGAFELADMAVFYLPGASPPFESEQRATAQIQKVVNDSGLANLVEANVHFPPVNIKGQNTLLGTVYVQRQAGVTQSSESPRVIGHKTCTSVAGLKPRSGIRLLTNY